MERMHGAHMPHESSRSLREQQRKSMPVMEYILVQKQICYSFLVLQYLVFVLSYCEELLKCPTFCRRLEIAHKCPIPIY